MKREIDGNQVKKNGRRERERGREGGIEGEREKEKSANPVGRNRLNRTRSPIVIANLLVVIGSFSPTAAVTEKESKIEKDRFFFCFLHRE